MRDRVIAFFSMEGFDLLETNLPECLFFLQREKSFDNIIMVVFHREGFLINEEVLDSFKKFAEKSFKEKGFGEIHFFTLIFSLDEEGARAATENDRFSWVIDVKENVLYIDSNKAQDYYGMKGKLLNFLSDTGKPLEEINRLQSVYEEQRRVVREEIRKKKEPKFFPVGSVSLCGILLLFFVIYLLNPYLSKLISPYYEETVLKGQWYRLLTGFYFNKKFYLLIYSLFCLLLSGALVEKRIGTVKLMVTFNIIGILSTLATVLITKPVITPNDGFGSFGAIMGIIGVYISLRIIECVQKHDSSIWIEAIFCIIGIVYFFYEFMYYTKDLAGLVSGLVLGLAAGLVLHEIVERKSKKQGEVKG